MAMNNLKSISELFPNQLFKIPDYQRGYAWEDKHLGEFWCDLKNLSESGIHYTGVLTLERVPEDEYKKWDDDKWIIEGKNYKPFFVVDGQQRLITILILLTTIIEKMDNRPLCYHSKEEIQAKYIFQTKDKGISKSFILGYIKDDPSYECLKTKIFKEHSLTNENIDTLYTKNLEYAKHYFELMLTNANYNELESIFRKLTQQFKFNVYEIDNDIDVFIAFETMNNRGKKLSNLELMKNRLIYLSTLLNNDESDKTELRKNINDCWKRIYFYIGKNKNKPLIDDEFLKDHWIMYFQFSKNIANAYIQFLLDENFTSNNVLKKIIRLDDIQKYVISMQESVKVWYEISNPYDSCYENDIIIQLDKLNRLGFAYYKPLLMASLIRMDKFSKQSTVNLLQVIERFYFLLTHISQKRSNTNETELYKLAKQMYSSEITAAKASSVIGNLAEKNFSLEYFVTTMRDKLDKEDGYFSWNGLNYFLYEYELYLNEMAKNNKCKISWEDFCAYKKDCVSVEHIYPQIATHTYWTSRFDLFSVQQKRVLTNSLGNLLLLSIKKNASLQNNSFDDKKIQKNGYAGYHSGSFSEIEVSKLNNWTADEIKNRGYKLLSFMENRWSIKIDDSVKEKLLYLEFVK